MKFQPIVRLLFNFLHIRFANPQSTGNTYENATATALALLITGCGSTDVYRSKQTGSSSTKGNHYPSFLRFWNWQKKIVDAAKICGSAQKKCC